jgi:hypothetical protein
MRKVGQEGGGDDGRELLHRGIIAKRDRMGVCLMLRVPTPQNIDPNQVVQLKGGVASPSYRTKPRGSPSPLRFVLVILQRQ